MSVAAKLREELLWLALIVFGGAFAIAILLERWRRAKDEARGPDLREAIRRQRARHQREREAQIERAKSAVKPITMREAGYGDE